MAREPMRKHSVRATDEEWERALAAADRNGENLSEAIRRFLREYGQREEPATADR